MSDPVRAITHRLRRCCADLAELTLDHAESSEWRTLLFDGGRHRITLLLRGDGSDKALAAMREEMVDPAFALPGHLLADIKLAAVQSDGDSLRIDIEALTLEDGLAVSV